MFLTKNNQFIWHRFAVAFAVVCSFAILGFLGLDAFLRPYFVMLDNIVWKWLDVFGEWKILAVAALVVFAAASLIVGRKSKITKLAANIFCSIVIAEFIVGIIKIFVGRARPPVAGFDFLSMDGAWHSFPSGHTAAAFAMLISIGLIYPKTKPFVWTLAVIAAISRVSVAAHWPSDVVFAAFIGMASADAVVYLRQYLFAKR